MEQTERKLLIGILTMPGNETNLLEDQYVLSQWKNYVEHYNHARAAPVRFDLCLTPEKLQQTLAALDGVIFTGGFLAIKTYTGRTEIGKTYQKTASEILRFSIEHSLPILGICQGHQVLC